MPNPTIAVLTDTFNRLGGVSSSYAYGMPLSGWGVGGNGLVDFKGSAWRISTPGKVSCYVLNGANNSDFLWQDEALTPGPNQAITGVTEAIPLVSGNLGYAVCVRGQLTGDCYVAILLCSNTANNFYIVKITGGTTITVLGTQQTAASVLNHQYAINLTVTGDGATTSLTATCTDVTTSTLLATATATDTTSELQSGGACGLLTALQAGGGAPASLSFTNMTVYSDTAYTATTVPIGYIGDSETYGLHTTQGPTPEILARLLSIRTGGAKRYVVCNLGQSGSTTAFWLSGNASGFLTSAVSSLNAIAAKTVFLMLGGNDAQQNVTASTWLANMQAIINYLNANITGVTVVVNFPPWPDIVRFGAPSNTLTLLQSYFAVLSSLTGCVIGETAAFAAFKNVSHFATYDGGHPNDVGAPLLAALQAAASPFGGSTGVPAGQAVGNAGYGGGARGNS